MISRYTVIRDQPHRDFQRTVPAIHIHRRFALLWFEISRALCKICVIYDNAQTKRRRKAKHIFPFVYARDSTPRAVIPEVKSSVPSQDDDDAPSVIKDNERKNNQNNKSALVGGGCSGFSYHQDIARILGVKPSN